MRKATNPWEESARTKKVIAILALVPAGDTAAEMGEIADWLAALPQADRDALAAAAGVNSPSPETWGRLVDAARARVARSDAFARAGRGQR